MKHENIGCCLSCHAILDRYPQFQEELRTWFEAIQIEHPDCHVSSAGRGKIDQEVAFERGASKAHYGQSAHNYNSAVDLFQLKDEQAFWTPAWFQLVVQPNLYPALHWYGERGSEFYELPHIELRNWRELVKKGSASLVEAP